MTKDQEDIKRTIVLYPGRFQPMGKHHADVFKELENIWGKGNVYVITSNKVSPPKSPLDFEEKKKIMVKHGIPESQIISAKSPYSKGELDPHFSPDETVAIYAVGEKDMAESPRFKNLDGTRKDGMPTWYKSYSKNRNNLETFDKHGYIMVVPHVSRDVGSEEMSGTTIRNFLSDPNMTPESFSGVMGWFDEDIYGMVRNKMKNSTSSLSEEILSFIEKTVNELRTGSGITGSYEEKRGYVKIKRKNNEDEKEHESESEDKEDEKSRNSHADIFDPLEEISAMAAGAVSGGSVGSLKKKKKNDLYELQKESNIRGIKLFYKS